MSKKLLGVVSAPVDGTLSTLGMAPHDGRCGELHLGMDSCLHGVFSFSLPVNCCVKTGFDLCKNNEQGLNKYPSTLSLRLPIT